MVGEVVAYVYPQGAVPIVTRKSVSSRPEPLLSPRPQPLPRRILTWFSLAGALALSPVFFQ